MGFAEVEGLRWETETFLRIGRLNNLDVVLRDYSVDRLQAEVRYSGGRWLLRDLSRNPAHPTLVNSQPMAKGEQPLQTLDILQFGKLHLRVLSVETGEDRANTLTVPLPPSGSGVESQDKIKTSGVMVRVQARTQKTWDQALEMVALGQEFQPRRGRAMLTLLRANHHLGHLGNLEELLQSILLDALTALEGQRGSILLDDPISGQLELKANLAPGLPGHLQQVFSRTLVQRCYRQGESLLCRDVNADDDLVHARSVRHGEMSSVICALLRTPRRRLGVIQLDRGPFQEPFSENDLYLVDALAASAAVGIECAQLVEQEREQFIQTVTTLARAVEMRDQYTGDHTRRVTDYALLLADELKLSATDKYQIQVGTPLHDIGKIGIDDAILRKPGKLTATEFEYMKTHTTKGANILETIYRLVPMIPIVRHHHERWDGNGYSDRLAGDQISLTARIVAVADAFDAMTSNRPYRPAFPVEKAFFELLHQAGKHFDPMCVQAFMQQRHKVESMLGKP
ncbi:MAG: HD domain-containing protein [Gemmataceae bacterium]|nr:HD domain-containing protein [Gemmataceae bacterium]MCI0742384.1 HD domain-containing protein [Gemmataceae bacterium]